MFSAEVEVDEQSDLDGDAEPLELVSFPVISEIDTDSLVSSGVPVPATSRNSELPFFSILGTKCYFQPVKKGIFLCEKFW